MEPEVAVKWPEEPLPALGDPVGLTAGGLMEELSALWPLLADTVARTGPGCLWPGSLRWDEDEGWQILSMPPYGSGEPPLPDTPGAKERDAWAVAAALITVAAGRAPRDVADARALLDLQAGVLPHGLDALVATLLDGGDAAAVHGALCAASAAPPGPVAARAAAETAVGSAKAAGDPEWDNEDSFAVVRTASRMLALAVCDGVTGDRDGQGARASRAAVQALRDCFATEEELKVALGIADRAVRRESSGSSTALVALIAPDGRTELASIGDSPAWLVRPLYTGGHVAFRLTPAQTVLAGRVLSDPGADGGASVLDHFLGGEAGQPYLATVRVVPGDRLVLLSDGAAGTDEAWFGADLAALATEHPRPAALAAALIGRAERLGGHDNATAVIAEIRAD